MQRKLLKFLFKLMSAMVLLSVSPFGNISVFAQNDTYYDDEANYIE